MHILYDNVISNIISKTLQRLIIRVWVAYLTARRIINITKNVAYVNEGYVSLHKLPSE